MAVERQYTDEELLVLVQDYLDGKIFTSQMVSKDHLDLLPSIFMPIVFMTKETLDDLERKGLVFLYEYRSAASRLGVNGYPIFSSARYMLKVDYDRFAVLHAEAAKIKAAARAQIAALAKKGG